MTPASLTAVARHLSFIRETQGPNRGAWVQALQRFCAGQPGDSWCADFVSFCLDVAYFGKSPVRRSGSTQVILADAKRAGYLVNGAAMVDDLFFFVRPDGTPHHVGIVTGTSPLTGLAGNTSTDGVSSNGVGVFEHPIVNLAAVVFVRLPHTVEA